MISQTLRMLVFERCWT